MESFLLVSNPQSTPVLNHPKIEPSYVDGYFESK